MLEMEIHFFHAKDDDKISVAEFFRYTCSSKLKSQNNKF